jgi:hypothetical protein
MRLAKFPTRQAGYLSRLGRRACPAAAVNFCETHWRRTTIENNKLSWVHELSRRAYGRVLFALRARV